MFTVPYGPEIERHAQRMLEQADFGRRHYANGSRQQQLTGLMGQTLVQTLLSQPLPEVGPRGDGGVDFSMHGFHVDVKTMQRRSLPKPWNENNYMAAQAGGNTDIVIFCSLNPDARQVTICGWITKTDLLRKATIVPRGTLQRRNDGSQFETRADLYVIKNQLLHDVRSLAELDKGLARLRAEWDSVARRRSADNSAAFSAPTALKVAN